MNISEMVVSLNSSTQNFSILISSFFCFKCLVLMSSTALLTHVKFTPFPELGANRGRHEVEQRASRGTRTRP
eukprot:5258543-Heterocapsa_arctica.AAC.1